MDGWRVGVDVGGTFTDVALMEEATGRLVVRKFATVTDNPVAGVLAGIEETLGATALRGKAQGKSSRPQKSPLEVLFCVPLSV